MDYYGTRSKQPKCKICGRPIKEWNPLVPENEHIDCAANRISERILSRVKLNQYQRRIMKNKNKPKPPSSALCAGKYYPHRYWECECCGLLISMPQQDDVSRYDCPACKMAECSHGGKFKEIALEKFCANANISSDMTMLLPDINEFDEEAEQFAEGGFSTEDERYAYKTAWQECRDWLIEKFKKNY